MKRIDPTPTLFELRRFFLIAMVGVTALFVGLPYYKNNLIHTERLVVLLVFFIVVMMVPTFLKKFRQAWLWLGETLGKINGVIVFSILFITLFCVVSLFFKILKRDRLRLQFKKYQSLKTQKIKISSFGDMF